MPWSYFLVVPILCFFLVPLEVLDCFHSLFFEQILACYLLFFFNYLDVCSWALKFYFFGCHCFFSVQQLEWCFVDLDTIVLCGQTTFGNSSTHFPLGSPTRHFEIPVHMIPFALSIAPFDYGCLTKAKHSWIPMF